MVEEGAVYIQSKHCCLANYSEGKQINVQKKKRSKEKFIK